MPDGWGRDATWFHSPSPRGSPGRERGRREGSEERESVAGGGGDGKGPEVRGPATGVRQRVKIVEAKVTVDAYTPEGRVSGPGVGVGLEVRRPGSKSPVPPPPEPTPVTPHTLDLFVLLKDSGTDP